MKPITPALQAHLDGALTTLAYLIKITRTDGVVMGFTNCDQDLVVGGVAYQADGSFTPSIVESTAGLATDNLEITGIVNSSAITDDDIARGIYDHARVDMYACNWMDVTQGVIQLRRGWMGEILRQDGHYTAELRGLHDLMQRPIGSFYTAECRFDLGDSACGVNLPAVTVSGSVSSIIDRGNFVDTGRSEISGTFDYGKLVWLTGANSGVAMDVKAWDGMAQTMTLWLPAPHSIALGDTYSVNAGCDKRFSTCKNKFSNAAQFGGFPYIPGVGNILKYPT